MQVAVGVRETVREKHLVVVMLESHVEGQSIEAPVAPTWNLPLELVLVVTYPLPRPVPPDPTFVFLFIAETQNFHAIIIERI